MILTFDVGLIVNNSDIFINKDGIGIYEPNPNVRVAYSNGNWMCTASAVHSRWPIYASTLISVELKQEKVSS